MKYLKSVLAMLIMTLPLQALAYRDGNELFNAMSSQNSRLEALLYVNGVSAGLLVGYGIGSKQKNGREDTNLKPRYPYCIPETMTYMQAHDVVYKYLQENPAERHMPNSVLILFAMEKAFPCVR